MRTTRLSHLIRPPQKPQKTRENFIGEKIPSLFPFTHFSHKLDASRKHSVTIFSGQAKNEIPPQFLRSIFQYELSRNALHACRRTEGQIENKVSSASERAYELRKS
jgi:hypothetical protein